MKRKTWIYLILFLSLTTLIFRGVTSIFAADDVLDLSSPTTCPSGGCVAGQRLNFLLNFSVSPATTETPNTQICVFAPVDGQTVEGIQPWANIDKGWLSETGQITGLTYTPGQTNDICTNNTQAEEQLIYNAYATYAVASDEQLEFALNIDVSADLDGFLRVKIFQAEQDGSWNPAFTTLEKPIPIASVSNFAYVALSASECENNSPCFVNSGEDLPDGVGTGLRDAVAALSPQGEIRILQDYLVKDHAVLIDKNLTIIGQGEASLSYSGTNCSEPLLLMINGGMIQNLTINDGNCASPSRNLIQINSNAEVFIQNNTLMHGNQAVRIEDNEGDVTIAFNHIENNQDFAIYRKSGTANGQLNIFANNIFNNRSGTQVDCKNLGHADHNFWGISQLADENVENCLISNGKQLGAPIQIPEGKAGVDALEATVSSSKTYYFNNRIAVWHSEGTDYKLIIANHGQGSEDNIPFSQSGAEPITPCSNFYDIFLQEDSDVSNLMLALKYDLNNSCINIIESSSYCSQTEAANKYPLWWYDPANNLTDGWDTTGQNPAGSNAGCATGQETTCSISNKEITVSLDNTGRPNLSADLNFTPFVVGLPLTNGINLAQFTAIFNINKIDLKWVTNSENDIQGFFVQRSDSQDGPFTRISQMIDAIGNNQTGGTYNYSDSSVTPSETYYYKIEVIDNLGDTIESHGPISIFAVTPTPTQTITGTITITNTPTITRTSFPTRTATQYFFRTRTRAPAFVTSTPRGGPTQVRTYGPTPTGSQTIFPNQSTTPGPELEANIDPNTGYPITGSTPQVAELLSEPPNEEGSYPITTPNPQEEVLTEAGSPQDQNTQSNTPLGSNLSEEGETGITSGLQWHFILIGAAAGLVLLLIVSLLLARVRFL